jgi:hypothetical protein
VTQIGDLKNQGAGAHSKNWLYAVNDQPGEISAGLHTLQPGDDVLWKFAVLE